MSVSFWHRCKACKTTLCADRPHTLRIASWLFVTVGAIPLIGIALEPWLKLFAVLVGVVVAFVPYLMLSLSVRIVVDNSADFSDPKYKIKLKSMVFLAAGALAIICAMGVVFNGVYESLMALDKVESGWNLIEAFAPGQGAGEQMAEVFEIVEGATRTGRNFFVAGILLCALAFISELHRLLHLFGMESGYRDGVVGGLVLIFASLTLASWFGFSAVEALMNNLAGYAHQGDSDSIELALEQGIKRIESIAISPSALWISALFEAGVVMVVIAFRLDARRAS